MVIPVAGRGAEAQSTPAYTFDAFISYRRKDGTRIARRLRERLLGYQLPAPFEDRRRKLNVYLDEVYEAATEDFFEGTIKPALKSSRMLIVVQTPAAAEHRSDGTENWVAREVRYFRSLPGDRRVCVALGSGGFDDPLPAELDRELPNVERVDVRGLARRFGFLSENELIKYIGPIYDIQAHELPRLRREEERRVHAQRMKFRTIAGSLILIFLLLAALATAGWIGASREARRQRSLQLAGQAAATPSGELDLALLLVAEALRTELTPEARRAATQILSDHPKLLSFFHCPGVAYSLAYLMNDDLLVLGCEDWLIGWRLETRAEQFRLGMSESPISLLAVDEHGLVIAGGAMTMTVVDAEGRSEVVPTTHKKEIKRLSLSRPTGTITSEDWSGEFRYWNVEPPQDS